MGIDPDSGLIVWNPETAGTYVVIVTVTDVGGLSANTSFEITVEAGDLATIEVTPADIEVVVGTEAAEAFEAQGYDEYGNEIADLTYTWGVTGDGNTIVEGLVTASTVAGVFDVTAEFGVVTSNVVTVTVIPGALASFVFDPIVPQTSGAEFGITITAEDANGNTVTSYAETCNLTGGGTGVTLDQPFTVIFANGIGEEADVIITVTATTDDVFLTINENGITDDSDAFTVTLGS